MGFREREVGHMTFKKWHSLHKAYKQNFDLEMQMKNKQVTYKTLEKDVTIDDVIPL